MPSNIHKRSLKKVLRLLVQGSVKSRGAHQSLRFCRVYSIKSNMIIFIRMQKQQFYLSFVWYLYYEQILWASVRRCPCFSHDSPAYIYRLTAVRGWKRLLVHQWSSPIGSSELWWTVLAPSRTGLSPAFTPSPWGAALQTPGNDDPECGFILGPSAGSVQLRWTQRVTMVRAWSEPRQQPCIILFDKDWPNMLISKSSPREKRIVLGISSLCMHAC